MVEMENLWVETEGFQHDGVHPTDCVAAAAPAGVKSGYLTVMVRRWVAAIPALLVAIRWITYVLPMADAAGVPEMDALTLIPLIEVTG